MIQLVIQFIKLQLAGGIIFLVSREWIFNKKTDQKRSRQQVVQFALFMGLNYVLSLWIIAGLDYYFIISPYIGQLISGLVLGLWAYFGLKIWVFKEQLARPKRRKELVKKTTE